MSFIVALPPPIALNPAARLMAWTFGRAALWTAKDPDTRLPRGMAQTRRLAARPSTLAEAEHAVHAVTTATLRLGGATACLPRAVAALLWCRAHRHTPDLVIGLRPGTGDVHAWIEADGQPAGEPSDPRTAYTPVTVYRWSATR